MKMSIMVISALLMSVVAHAEWTDLNAILTSSSPYLRINSFGAILKPDSAIPFKKTSNGYDNEYNSVKRITQGDSSFYLSVTKSQFGRGSLVEAKKDGLVAITNCVGDSRPNNSTGFACSTLSTERCVQLYKNFGNIDNPAMMNPIVQSAFKDIANATNADAAQTFKNNLRECSNVLMMVNNMEGNKDGFNLDAKHEKILKDNIKSYAIRKSSMGDNGNNVTLQKSTMAVLEKAEIFTKCGDLLARDQELNKRKTLLPTDAKGAPLPAVVR
ncbi:MAG: hypothetical protein JNL11_16030 [Bdellovibrionaceae bacterium]|nr:hypothetical protein [Pseudobdellovibrionaceae bacterium]